MGAPGRGAERKFSVVSNWKSLPVSLLRCVVQMVSTPQSQQGCGLEERSHQYFCIS